MATETTVPIQCPVEGCDFKPPANLSEQAQIKSVSRHINLRHSVADLPAMVDGIKELQQEQQQPEQPQESEKPQPEPEPEPEPQTRVSVQSKETKPNSGGKATVTPISAATSTGDAKKDRINRRAEEWGNYLHKDFNPLLVTYTGKFIGVPDDSWLKGGPANGQPVTFTTPDGKQVTFWNPTIEEQLTLSEKDCKKLAKAGAMFAESNMGQLLTAWMENNAHWVAVGAALLVAGSYGWRVMRLRTEIEQLKQVIEQQMSMATPQAGSNGSEAEAA